MAQGVAARVVFKMDGEVIVTVSDTLSFDIGGVSREEILTDVQPGEYFSEAGRSAVLTGDFVYAAGVDIEKLKRGKDLEIAVEYPDAGDTWTIVGAYSTGEGTIQSGQLQGAEFKGGAAVLTKSPG